MLLFRLFNFDFASLTKYYHRTYLTCHVLHPEPRSLLVEFLLIREEIDAFPVIDHPDSVSYTHLGLLF